jgi:CheY-like chemotaxis protein
MTRRSILIVDDEFALAEIVADLLSEQGHEVSVAINGQLGLDLLAGRPTDLVMVDVMMPVLGGPDMVRAMRARPQLARIPVIMMTSLEASLPADQPRLYDAFLHKPFSPEELFQTLARLLK